MYQVNFFHAELFYVYKNADASWLVNRNVLLIINSIVGARSKKIDWYYHVHFYLKLRFLLARTLMF